MNILNIKTAIIGAGISGISTAISLLNKNYEDFVIFEANNRIGGRCHTIDYGNEIIELGAQFIHGQVDNPIYKLAIENSLISDEYKHILHENDEDLIKHNGLKINFEEKEEKTQLFCTEKGEIIDEDLIQTSYYCLNKSIRFAENYFRLNKSKQDLRLGDFIYENYKKFLSEDLEESILSDETNRQLLDSIFQWRCKWENIENGCSSVFDLSLNNFSNFFELKGSQIMELTKGYHSVIDCLLSKHKIKFEKSLKINHCLDKILICEQLLNDSEQICEHCNYTNDKNKIVLIFKHNKTVYICDNVVCTVSLGYLKENIERLIKPNSFIKSEKLKAIKRMGYGTVNKIILVYEKPFWEEKLEGINLIWLNKNKNELFNTLNHVEFNYENRWFEDICSFEPAINHKNVLIGWIGGNNFHENLSDEQVKKDCTSLLRKFLSRNDIPDPVDILRSKWNSDPFFKGSYSFYAYGTCSNDIETIAEPIFINNKPFIQFAGEATHPDYYSTVHGAYLSGIREAERILNCLK